MDIQHIECCYIIGDILCVVQNCTRDPTGKLWCETRISRSLMRHCLRILEARMYMYIANCYATMSDNKLMYLMTAYYTPNDSFTANDALFYKNKLGQLHYTLWCLFN